MNPENDNRNTIYFLVASMALLFAYQFFIVMPQQKEQRAAQAVAAAAAASSSSTAALAGPLPGQLTVDAARARSPRVAIDTPSLKGSIALNGALFDDLYLVKFNKDLDPKSGPVELLRPAGAENTYYVESGFLGSNIANLPNSATPWQLVTGTSLGVGHPVVLGYDNGTGLRFRRTISIDDNYMISVSDAVSNLGAQPVTINPYTAVTRVNMPIEAAHSGYVHEGTLATYFNPKATAFGDKYNTRAKKYKELADGAKKKKEKDSQVSGDSTGGWVAITDRYWMAAAIPDQKAGIHYSTAATQNGSDTVFRAGYTVNNVTIHSGKMVTLNSRVFAGAKTDKLLRAYQKDLGIPRLKEAIDWGSILGFLAYGFYWLLTWLYDHVHNYGVAILCMTVIIRAIFYPLAHRSYEQMTKMRHVQQRLQPKLDAIKKRHADDPQKQQEATMALYQEEKVNPMAGLSGCLPMLLQLPVFIVLVKVLQLDIGLRHAPFFGWIQDLSAPDPLSIVNLFGFFHFTPADVPVIGGFLAGPLHIGPVAILYGLSMWASQQMTPMVGIDPMQKKMMAFMPLIMVFFFTQLAIGLMIYYCWSNILTMLQQYTIMRRLKVDNPIDDLIAKITGKSEKKTAA